jgi:hypothetical protein
VITATAPALLDEGEDTSPLWMITREPALNELVRGLQRFREAYERQGDPGPLTFSRREIALARAAFGDMIRRGEERLHQLCGLLAHGLLGRYQMQSVVIGEVAARRERFTLMLDLSPEQLLATTDLDLGTRQLERLRFVEDGVEHRAALVSNVVEYQAVEPNRYTIYKLLSRVKAEEEIWNKVADEIFNLDGLVLRDKQLRHLSRFVKDVFGIKIVVGTHDDVYKVQKAIAMMELDKASLATLGLGPPSHKLSFVEVKDYLSRIHRKRSGWEAMKSVVRWADKTFEIQVQPLGNFLHERELLTKESHAGFKTRREQLREQVAEQMPLFGYYLKLLRWLFSGTQGQPPLLPGIEVRLLD